MIFTKLNPLSLMLSLLVLQPVSHASGSNSGAASGLVGDMVEEIDTALYQTPADQKAKYELPVSFVKFQNLKWTRGQVLDQVNYLAGIYRQCAIRVGTVKIYDVGSYMPPEEISFTKPEMPVHGYQTIAQNVSIADRPLVFLVNGMLKDDHATSFAVAKWKAYPDFKVHPSVNNTAWLIHPITSKEYEEREHPGCINCVLPHELGHVLMRDNMHNGDRPPNLMSSARMGGRNNSLPPHICEEIYQSDLLKRLP